MTGNAIALPRSGGGLMSRDDLKRSLTNAAMSMPSIGGDKPFLKMDKGDGTWVYGQEETEVEDGSLWAVNPLSLEHGYIAWGDGEPEGEVMMPIGRELPPAESLKPVNAKDGWQRQQSVDLVCISGEDEGTVVQYKQSSVGAMKLFGTLTNALLQRVEKNIPEIVPIIKMTSTDYKHKKYGRIYNPIFEITEWRGMDDATPANTASPATAPAETAPPADAAGGEESEEERKLAAEYEREKAAEAATGDATPRRRTRRS